MRGLRRLGAMGLIAAFSAIDMCGALARGLGINTLGKAEADAQALSYHKPATH